MLEIRFKFRVWYRGYRIRKMRMAEYNKRKAALAQTLANKVQIMASGE